MHFVHPDRQTCMSGGGEVWVLEVKADLERQGNLYELKGKLSAFLILGQTTQKDPHSASPAHSQLTPLSPRLKLQGNAGLLKKMSQKRNLNFKRRLI